jgi:hypothetical protein
MNGTKNNAKGFAKIDRSSVMLLEPPRAANDSPGQRMDPAVEEVDGCFSLLQSSKKADMGRTPGDTHLSVGS